MIGLNDFNLKENFFFLDNIVLVHRRLTRLKPLTASSMITGILLQYTEYCQSTVYDLCGDLKCGVFSILYYQ